MGKRASLITLLPVLAVSDDEGFAVFPFPAKIKNKLFLHKKINRATILVIITIDLRTLVIPFAV